MIVWLEVLQRAAIVLIGILVVGVLYLVTDIQRRLGPDYGATVPKDGLPIGTPPHTVRTTSRAQARRWPMRPRQFHLFLAVAVSVFLATGSSLFWASTIDRGGATDRCSDT